MKIVTKGRQKGIRGIEKNSSVRNFKAKKKGSLNFNLLIFGPFFYCHCSLHTQRLFYVHTNCILSAYKDQQFNFL